MKPAYWLVIAVAFLLFACQPTTLPAITIIDNDQVVTLQTAERVPSAILAQAGITLNPNDRLLLNGLPIAPNSPVPTSPITLQLRRAVAITISSPQGKQTIQTSAFTVGEALQEAGIQLSASDKVDPPLYSPILQFTDFPITIYPSRELTVSVDGKVMQIQSSAKTVGEALAEAGIPLLGLDYSLPLENEALPSDGRIRVVRVSESILLAQKSIVFESELIASADVPLDQTRVLQPGENGLTVQRIRIRYEDGTEISRVIEDETLVRPPKDRILGYGTKVEIKTAVVDGVSIEYWRAVQMYATSYSPCRSGGDRCYSGTSSGARVQKGVVGLRYSWYLVMQGQPLYIPGYGYATVADVCGGCVGRPWIDLGYSDEDWEQWSSWVTVYFLTPVPQNIVYVLE
ncbi:MAG: ubiquitin-like domain-containing protein [Anaerolineales bacterium]|nr:ubiquitin-like domain-containing protein [Anaerolineales bacterium]NUQ84468.1 DUF348 domain-containing protein [Anaerolineales bacterium]